ncbi:MAG: TetR/AcrR family transcriptional regulator [Hyphomicrobiales bacterium]|nr:TetR/AcrR family transcriptional regulator [Hyphomicrobiales bacterium]
MVKAAKDAEIPPRERIVRALMHLAAEMPFERITITGICTEAGVSLAAFRELFPSKGAILGAYARGIDLQVLKLNAHDLDDEPAKDRLFDVLMRRLDAMAADKAALEAIARWARREPLSALALNQVALNSMRFMLETAGIDSEGPLGALKLQGLVLAWTQVLEVWFKDDRPGLDATMAALDKALERGGRLVGQAESMSRLFGPLELMGRTLHNLRRDSTSRMRERWNPPKSDEQAGV